jgi:sugar-phosphatase
MIKAAIFDMDGLLVDSDPLWQQTVREVYAKLGIKLNEDDHSRMIGRPTAENAEYLFSRYSWEGPSVQEVVDDIFDRMAVRINNESALMPGVHHVLQVCKKAGLPAAIASSSPQRLIDTVVDHLEIRDHFHHIYSAQFEPFGKPHPGVFISVAKHFGVDVHDCLVFEDSPSGVLAAKAARMKCAAVPAEKFKNDKFIQTADVILESLEDFDAPLLQTL